MPLQPHSGTKRKKNVWQFLLWVWCGMSHCKISKPSVCGAMRTAGGSMTLDRMRSSMRFKSKLMTKNIFHPEDSSRETSMMQALMCIYRDWMNTTFITWPLLINPQPMFGASWFACARSCIEDLRNEQSQWGALGHMGQCIRYIHVTTECCNVRFGSTRATTSMKVQRCA